MNVYMEIMAGRYLVENQK